MTPDAVGIFIALFHGRSRARFADALLIDLTNFAHVGFLRACDVVEGIAEVAHAGEGSIVLGNPGASRISETELRSCVSTRLGSATRNTVVVPLTVRVGGTDTFNSLGDAGDGVALVVGPSAEAIHNTVIECGVAAESVVAAGNVTEGASVVTIAAENVGVVLAGRSVDAHVVDNGARVSVLREGAIGGAKLRADSRVDEALVGCSIPVAASGIIASSLGVVGEATRGLADRCSGVPFALLVVQAGLSIGVSAELRLATSNGDVDEARVGEGRISGVGTDGDGDGLRGWEFGGPRTVRLHHGVEDRGGRNDDGLTFSPESDEVVLDETEGTGADVEGLVGDTRVPAPAGSAAGSCTSGTEPSGVLATEETSVGGLSFTVGDCGECRLTLSAQ